MSTLDDILAMARNGLRIHPLLAKSKVPLLKSWQTRATVDTNTITEWYESHPDCNWGMATGPESGVFVVDIDPKNGGDQTWSDIEKQHGKIITPTVVTGTGGRHLYLKYPVNGTIHNRAGSVVGPGIDIRGIGGQVVVPPSIHPNGNQYKWDDNLSMKDVELAKPPRWLLKMLTNTLSEDYQNIGESLERGNRNSTIFHQAFVLARSGATREIVYATMRTWCDETGNEDIQTSEINTTVDSAFKRAESEREKLATKKAISGKTDDDNARRFISKYGDQVIYVAGLGWFVWDGRHWEPDSDNARVISLAIQTMRELRDEALEEMKDATLQRDAFVRFQWATASLNLGKLNAMIELASKYKTVRRTTDDLDSDTSKWLLNLKNGTLDLRTGVLRSHNKDDMLTKIIDHNYDSNAKAPMWESTMQLAFNHDAQMIEFMQRALGYSITASTAEQCIFIAWGESGNNGKSTILEGLQRILGTGYAQMSDMKVITSDEMDNRVASSLAKLYGVRLVSMNEAEERQHLSEALVKQLTGGDTIEACKKYREPFTYRPVMKLWIRTNEKPVIRGMTEAIWRRIKLIPFVQPIPKDERLSRDVVDTAIQSEAEGVIAWLVRGCKAWMDGGLTEPPQIQHAVNEYKSEMDITENFLEEATIRGDMEVTFCTRQELYTTFVQWCKLNGYRYIMTADAFGKRISKALDQHKRVKVGGQYVWKGIQINDQYRFYG